jgi:SAM-dependent methyltransferase
VRGGVSEQVWRSAQSGHLGTWVGFAEQNRRNAPERAAVWANILAAVEEQSPARPGEAVLDVGCGLDTVLDFVPQARGFTLDSLMAELVQFGLSQGIEHTAATCEFLPFRSASFDRAFCMNMLDHVRDPVSCVAELVRVLRPGGTLVISVDTYSGRRYLEKRARKWWDRLRGARTKHPWVFSRESVTALLEREGLKAGAPTHVDGTKERRTFLVATKR